jgi:hypothetical protein
VPLVPQMWRIVKEAVLEPGLAEMDVKPRISSAVRQPAVAALQDAVVLGFQRVARPPETLYLPSPSLERCSLFCLELLL